MTDIFDIVVPEITQMIRFKHENIVECIDYFASNTFLYIVSEYCEVLQFARLIRRTWFIRKLY